MSARDFRMCVACDQMSHAGSFLRNGHICASCRNAIRPTRKKRPACQSVTVRDAMDCVPPCPECGKRYESDAALMEHWDRCEKPSRRRYSAEDVAEAALRRVA